MIQKLSPYQACKLFMNIRTHFSNEKFDITASNGIRYSEDSFEKRKDKGYFTKLAHEYASGDLGYFFMSNLLDGNNHPSGMMDITYREWKARMHKIEYIFNEDCMLIYSHMIQQELTFNDFFVSNNGGLPISIQMLNGNMISIETICLIDALFDGFIIQRMDTQITDRFVWDKIRIRIVKYAPWIKRYYKAEEIKAILRNYT